MHTHGIPTSLTPAASDIALLQEMYGVRGADANETNKANDTLNDATRIRFSSDPNFDGTHPLVHFGEISNASDRDIFFFETPSNYQGAVTIHVVSAALSELQYRLSVKDRNGNLLTTADSTEKLGGDVKVQLPPATGGTCAR